MERAAIEEKTQNEINQLFVLAEQLFREMEQAEELRRMAQQQLNLAGKELLQARITSYNVCYTKLLRRKGLSGSVRIDF